jgi:hypothetical protein
MMIAQSASLTCRRQRVSGVHRFAIFGGTGRERREKVSAQYFLMWISAPFFSNFTSSIS